MQWPKGLIAPHKKLELHKENNQAFDSLIDFSFHILQTYFLTYFHT